MISAQSKCRVGETAHYKRGFSEIYCFESSLRGIVVSAQLCAEKRGLAFSQLADAQAKMSLKTVEISCRASLFETMFKFTILATHIIKLFEKKEEIVTSSRTVGTRGSYGSIEGRYI